MLRQSDPNCCSCYELQYCNLRMKRKSSAPNIEDLLVRKKLINRPHSAHQVTPSDSPSEMGDREEEEMLTDNGDNGSANVTYNVPVANRFAKLPIPIPGATTMNVRPKTTVRAPPPIHVFNSTREVVDKLIPDSVIAVCLNGTNCILVYCNTPADYKALDALFRAKKLEVHTHSPDQTPYKKFVLSVQEVHAELVEYGLPLN